MSINDGGPAFPFAPEFREGDEDTYFVHPGMSLRDWFAGQALAGMVANKGITDLYRRADVAGAQRKIAGAAYEVADAMLAARGEG